jgi:hypothetical protein
MSFQDMNFTEKAACVAHVAAALFIFAVAIYCATRTILFVFDLIIVKLHLL